MSERHETFGALTDPDGALTLNAEQVWQLCRGVPVQAYCGIGPRPARIQVPPYGRAVMPGARMQQRADGSIWLDSDGL